MCSNRDSDQYFCIAIQPTGARQCNTFHVCLSACVCVNLIAINTWVIKTARFVICFFFFIFPLNFLFRRFISFTNFVFALRLEYVSSYLFRVCYVLRRIEMCFFLSFYFTSIDIRRVPSVIYFKMKINCSLRMLNWCGSLFVVDYDTKHRKNKIRI